MSVWADFTEETEEQDSSYSLLPDTLKDVWGDDSISFEPSHFQDQINFDQTYAASAPEINPYMGMFDGSRVNNSFMKRGNKTSYCTVQYHPNRINVTYFNRDLDVEIGDYVIIDADRGVDIGKILAMIENPSQRDTKTARQIIRKAEKAEIDKLPKKIEMEENALKICQAKAQELGLPMEITGAEYQFDFKKLTFYYSATRYIDFRNLVKILYKIFCTRIWMVWYDGSAPVKDVLTKNDSNI
ncbi:PSP1 C-terminal conserved region family protein [Histomonas meleagridis]|uniref:PSP1 C-terminal conserved region family protein n=1 Tax=Histomonas meleagridis TaxID=135588 RepID=UPI003559A119|nr:PSP1 C-terminal conserved region family protein [Histomonas meleagridis]KAH0802291.1 PSP1 C-terminal conserved region family protein [Histomonas meleagridis]